MPMNMQKAGPHYSTSQQAVFLGQNQLITDFIEILFQAAVRNIWNQVPHALKC